MGSGIAANFLKAGYEVLIWNRSADKTKDLQAAGAKLRASPKEATEHADIIFEVTANDESSQAVWQGEQGILAGADSSKILVTCATLSPEWVDSLNQECTERNFDFFDVPMTGGRVAAEEGTLTLLAGGDENKLKDLKPDLEAISSKVLYFGPVGSGMKYKLILNGLQAAHLAAFGEAMRLAKSQGLDPARVGTALCDRPGGVMTEIAWKAYQQAGEIPLTFSVDWIAKDLGYSRQMAGELNLPILDDVIKAYKAAQVSGHGDEDWATILKD